MILCQRSGLLQTFISQIGHNREFVWGPRGFNSVEEMNETILKNWNKVVQPNDIVFILGDLMLGNNDVGMKYLEQLNGSFIIVRGNHDTDNRVSLYLASGKVIKVEAATYYKYNGYHFYMTHYPCLTGNLQRESPKQMTLNLSGHTHSKNKFFYDLPYIYNVAMDAHNCTPVSLDQVIEDINHKVQECKDML